MKKLAGIALFLLAIYVTLLLSDPGARTLLNHTNLAKRIGLYGVLTLGAGVLIISGGIDLSIGSVVGLCGTVCVIALDNKLPPTVAFGATIALGSAIGLANGLLVTKLRVQPFIVTLCGLFIYRGMARWVAGDQVRGLGNRFAEWKELLAGDVLGLPTSFVILLFLAAGAVVLLHFSIYGRYLYAIGSNERAAIYSGIIADRYKVLAYVLCSTAAGLYAVLLLMELNSVQPSSTGTFLELYAIAGAVLGGCSLRAGEGTVVGMLIGTAILVFLPNLTNMLQIPASLEYTVIGTALLFGAILDELLRTRSQAKKG
jgi:ribose transport system permease protein